MWGHLKTPGIKTRVALGGGIHLSVKRSPEAGEKKGNKVRATHSTPADQRAEEADLETRLETISASLRSCWEGEAASGEVAAEMQRVSLGQTGRSPAEGFPSADRPSGPPHLASGSLSGVGGP